jgi:hypothetical protein
MPMRGQLSAPAMGAAWQKQPAGPAWYQISEILLTPDLVVVLGVSMLGLLASISAALFSSSFLNVVGS